MTYFLNLLMVCLLKDQRRSGHMADKSESGENEYMLISAGHLETRKGCLAMEM